jgi:hypothetical protein
MAAEIVLSNDPLFRAEFRDQRAQSHAEREYPIGLISLVNTQLGSYSRKPVAFTIGSDS